MTLALAAELCGIPLPEAEAWADERAGRPDHSETTLRATAFEALQLAMGVFTDIVTNRDKDDDDKLIIGYEDRIEAARELAKVAVALARVTARPKPSRLGQNGAGDKGRDLFDEDPWTG